MKTLIRILFISLFLIVSLSYGQGITNSAHDFSNKGWNSAGEICQPCHTPHDAIDEPNAPLWNHTLAAATGYTPYSGYDMDASVNQPDGSSKLCLSCHDGTVALDSFGGASGSTNIGGNFIVGRDLSHEHPISFIYNTALATDDGELHDPSAISSGIGTTIDADMLEGGKMQCSSCHDVHDKLGNSHLLVKINDGSALCLTCHNK